MPHLSIVDQPVKASITNLAKEDTLGTSGYAEALARFIRECETPLTIGIQGEWGSGKTSLLNMIHEYIVSSTVQPDGRSKEIAGKDYYQTIWIDTWEHSLMKSPEDCLFSIIEEIIEKITQVDGRWEAAQRAKSALGNLARGAARIGASMTMGVHAGHVVEDMLSTRVSNPIKELRSSLRDTVEQIHESSANSAKRFIIIVDDLDRLEPKVAVKVLELLKNIFGINHCVFLLAIDYQVVVKGLKDKFGKPSENNEWEFRAFFDKIIQVPFMMPMAQYNLGKFIINSLVNDIGYFSSAKNNNEAVLLEADNRLGSIVKYTIGHNPRSMKRLLNSVSLIKIQNEEELSAGNSLTLRQLIFSLVCVQISFPKIYELMLVSPDFSQWDEDIVGRVTEGANKEDADMNRALDRAVEINTEDFDEDWERALFMIVWCKNWQRNRLVDISRVLSIVKDQILDGVDAKTFESHMIKALKMTAVTAVAPTDDAVIAPRSDGDTNIRQARVKYWQALCQKSKNTGSVFDPNINPIKETHSAHYLSRRTDRLPWLNFVALTGSTTPVKIEMQSDGDEEIYRNYLKRLYEHRSTIEKVVGAKCEFRKMYDPNSKPYIAFDPPDGVPKRVRLELSPNEADAIQSWLAGVFPALEDFLVELKNNDLSMEAP